jgi:hypothetical protein
MQLTNLDINLLYNPGVMVSYSGRLVRHGINVAEGDRIVWAWFGLGSSEIAGLPAEECLVKGSLVFSPTFISRPLWYVRYAKLSPKSDHQTGSSWNSSGDVNT